MKTSFLLIMFSLLISCATATKHIPAEDIVFMTETPFGLVPMMMPKGYLDEKNKGETWVPATEYYKEEIEEEDV